MYRKFQLNSMAEDEMFDQLLHRRSHSQQIVLHGMPFQMIDESNFFPKKITYTNLEKLVKRKEKHSTKTACID